MASRFTLSNTEYALPETVEVDGSAFHINASYRNILRILAMLQDDEVVESHRPALLCKWFYDVTPSNIDAALNAFMDFLHRGDVQKDVDRSKPPSFDYEIDAPEVYASFVHLYGIDLLQTDMHWWRFSALLDGAFRTDCALSEKVKLRNIDASKCEHPEDVRRAQAAIRIETKQSRADQQVRDMLYDVLTSGGDVSAKLEAMKNGL